MPSNRQRPRGTVRSRASAAVAFILIAAGCALPPTAGRSTGQNLTSPTPAPSDATSSTPVATDAPSPTFDPLRDSALVVEVGEGPEGALVANDSVWIANHRGGSVARIDPATNEVTTITFRPGDRVHNVISSGGGAVWVDLFTAIGRIDVATNKATIITTGETVRESGGHVFGAGSLWLYEPPTLYRYDAATNERVESFEIGAFDPESRIAFGAGSVWIAESGTGLYRFDPEAKRVIAHVKDVAAYKVFSDGDSVWIADEGAGTVSRVNTTDSTVGAPIAVRRLPGGILGRVVGDELWTALSDQQGIIIVDGQTETITDAWKFTDPFSGYVDVGYGSLWVPVFHSNEVWRVDLLAIGKGS